MEQLYLVTGAYGHLGNTINPPVDSCTKEGTGIGFTKGHHPLSRGNGRRDYRKGHLQTAVLEVFFQDAQEQPPPSFTAQASYPLFPLYSQKVYDVNVTGIQNIIDACLSYGADRLVCGMWRMA